MVIQLEASLLHVVTSFSCNCCSNFDDSSRKLVASLRSFSRVILIFTFVIFHCSLYKVYVRYLSWPDDALFRSKSITFLSVDHSYDIISVDD